MRLATSRKRKTSAVVAFSARTLRTRRNLRRTVATRRKSLRRILQMIRAKMPEFVKEYHVKSLGVFGSYVREDATDKSDLDVLVEFEEGARISLFGLVGFQNEMSDLLGVQVDLIEKKGLKPRILENVIREVVGV